MQRRLNEPARLTNRTGNTTRRHLGSGLYLCGVCEKPVKAHSRRYRCPDAHLVRTREQVDNWVLRMVRARLAMPDLADALPSRDEPRLQALTAQIDVHKGKIQRAQNDYDNDYIEAYDLKRIRDRAESFVDSLEAERLELCVGSDIGTLLQAKNPVQAFDDADLMIKRRVIDFLCEVRLYPHPRGKKTFDPETVKLEPKVCAPRSRDRDRRSVRDVFGCVGENPADRLALLR